MISFYSRIFMFCLLPILGAAQVIDNYLVQPSISLGWNDGNRWSFNTTVENRSIIAPEGEILHVQGAQFVSYDLGFYTQIGVGVMYREIFDENSADELRLTQQFVHARKYNAVKLAHRIRWDQRIRGDAVTHRWRYRFSGSLPLNGISTDRNEFYLTANAEVLFIGQIDRKPAYDQRVAVGIGTQLTSKIKAQIVTELRIEDYTNDPDRLLFFNVGLYYKL